MEIVSLLTLNPQLILKAVLALGFIPLFYHASIKTLLKLILTFVIELCRQNRMMDFVAASFCDFTRFPVLYVSGETEFLFVAMLIVFSASQVAGVLVDRFLKNQSLRRMGVLSNVLNHLLLVFWPDLFAKVSL